MRQTFVISTALVLVAGLWFATQGEFRALVSSVVPTQQTAAVAVTSAYAFELVNNCVMPTIAPPDSTYYQKNRIYGTFGGQSQGFDIAWPKVPGTYPLLLLLHGGGWAIGDKSLGDTNAFREERIRRIASQGYVVATANYRLSNILAPQNKNHFPAAIQDTRCLVKWFRSNNHAYPVDKNKIAVLGTSAGGHLALMLALTEEKTELDSPDCSVNSYSAHINAAISYYGPTDLRRSNPISPNPDPDVVTGAENDPTVLLYHRIVNFLGAQPMDIPLIAANASPRYLVSQKNAAQIPPILLVHATDDGTVPINFSRNFAADLTQKGAQYFMVELEPRDGSEEEKIGHGFDPFGLNYKLSPGTCTTMNFLEQVFPMSSLDTTLPTVSLTAPAASSTVSGTVTLSASASDNVDVVGVQFKVDGANVGAEATTSPYSLAWNTTTSTNGTHTLRAVARDAAGNTRSTANRSVTVSNVTIPPLFPPGDRVETTANLNVRA